MMDCVTLLVRWRVIRPHVEDQLPHGFHEHVTLTQGPVDREKYHQLQGLFSQLTIYSLPSQDTEDNT